MTGVLPNDSVLERTTYLFIYLYVCFYVLFSPSNPESDDYHDGNGSGADDDGDKGKYGFHGR